MEYEGVPEGLAPLEWLDAATGRAVESEDGQKRIHQDARRLDEAALNGHLERMRLLKDTPSQRSQPGLANRGFLEPGVLTSQNITCRLRPS